MAFSGLPVGSDLVYVLHAYVAGSSHQVWDGGKQFGSVDRSEEFDSLVAIKCVWCGTCKCDLCGTRSGVRNSIS